MMNSNRCIQILFGVITLCSILGHTHVTAHEYLTPDSTSRKILPLTQSKGQEKVLLPNQLLSLGTSNRELAKRSKNKKRSNTRKNVKKGNNTKKRNDFTITNKGKVVSTAKKGSNNMKKKQATKKASTKKNSMKKGASNGKKDKDKKDKDKKDKDKGKKDKKDKKKKKKGGKNDKKKEKPEPMALFYPHFDMMACVSDGMPPAYFSPYYLSATAEECCSINFAGMVTECIVKSLSIVTDGGSGGYIVAVNTASTSSTGGKSGKSSGYSKSGKGGKSEDMGWPEPEPYDGNHWASPLHMGWGAAILFTEEPTFQPSYFPTSMPTNTPTAIPTYMPTTYIPTYYPTELDDAVVITTPPPERVAGKGKQGSKTQVQKIKGSKRLGTQNKRGSKRK